MSVEGRQKLQLLKQEVQDFLNSTVHRAYVMGTKRSLESCEEQILDDPISTLPEIVSLLQLKAKRELLRENLTLFEDKVATLEEAIQKMLDEENESAT